MNQLLKFFLQMALIGLISALSGSSGFVTTQSPQTIDINSVRWSPDGTKIAASGGIAGDPSNGLVQLVDAANESLLFRWNVNGLTDAIAWSSDSKLFAAYANSGHIYVWNAETGAKIADWTHPHRNQITIGWSYDGAFLATMDAELEGTVAYLWDAKNQFKQVKIISGGGTSFAWANKSLAIGFASYASILVASPEPSISTFQLGYGLPQNIEIAWSSDDSFVAASTAWYEYQGSSTIDIYRVRVFDTLSRTQVKEWSVSKIQTGLAWNHDGTELASVSTSELTVWEITTGKFVTYPFTSERGGTRYRRYIDWSPYGGRVVFGGVINPSESANQIGVHFLAPNPSFPKLQYILDKCTLQKSGQSYFDLRDSLVTRNLNQVLKNLDKTDVTMLPLQCRKDLKAIAESLNAK